VPGVQISIKPSEFFLDGDEGAHLRPQVLPCDRKFHLAAVAHNVRILKQPLDFRRIVCCHGCGIEPVKRLAVVSSLAKESLTNSRLPAPPQG